MAAKVTKKNLYDAVKNGNIATLRNWLQQNPNLVGDVSFAGSRNLLHVAAMLGETILHLAVRFNQLQTIRYLVKQPYIEKKAHNSLGKTALQILNENPHTPHYSDMEKLLKIPSTQKISNVFPNLTDTTMVVVVLIATMAFQAAVSPLGRVWQEHTTSHKAGDAVMMTSTHPKLYKQFVRANTIAIVSVIITIFLITTRQPSGRIVFLLISLFTMWLSLASIALSYGASIMVVSPNTETQSLVPVIIVVVVVSLGIIGFIYVYNIIREWILRHDTALPRSHTSSNRVINNVGRVLRSSGPKN